MNIEITNEQARQITVKYIVQAWNKSKDLMNYTGHLMYFTMLKEFATNSEIDDILILFAKYLPVPQRSSTP